MILFVTVVVGLIIFCLGLFIGRNSVMTHTEYLNNRYLNAVDKAQKANNKNKATAEFWYNESERYKSLLEANQHYLNK